MPLHLVFLLFLGLGRLLPAASAADEQFVFEGFKGANLSFEGMATLTPDGLLVLTNGTSQGHAFYPAPLLFRRAPNGTATAAMQSFSTAFVIGMIDGAPEDLSSHDMAFVVAKSSNFTSATNRLFAVEFNTILNPEFNDMSGNHVGVHVNGLSSVDADNATGAGAFRNMSLVSRNRKAMQMWVDYDGQTMQVNVTTAPLEAAARPKRHLISTAANLSSAFDDDTAYVGFSSDTGTLWVLGWSFKMNGAATALNLSALPALPVTFPKRMLATAGPAAVPFPATAPAPAPAASSAPAPARRRAALPPPVPGSKGKVEPPVLHLVSDGGAPGGVHGCVMVIVAAMFFFV